MSNIAILGPLEIFDCPSALLMNKLSNVLVERDHSVDLVNLNLNVKALSNKEIRRYLDKNVDEISLKVKEKDFVIFYLDRASLGTQLGTELNAMIRIISVCKKVVLSVVDFPEEFRRIPISRLNLKDSFKEFLNSKHLREFWNSIRKLSKSGKAAVMMHNPVYARHFTKVTGISSVIDHPLTFFTKQEVAEIKQSNAECEGLDTSRITVLSADYLDKIQDIKLPIETFLDVDWAQVILIQRTKLGDVQPRTPIHKPIYDIEQVFNNKVKGVLAKKSVVGAKEVSTTINDIKSIVESYDLRQKHMEKEFSPLPEELLESQAVKAEMKALRRKMVADDYNNLSDLLAILEKSLNLSVYSHMDAEKLALNMRRNIYLPGFRNIEQICQYMVQTDVTIFARKASWEHSNAFMAIAAQFANNILVSHIPVHHHLKEYWGNKLQFFDLGNTHELKRKVERIGKAEKSVDLNDNAYEYDLNSYADLYLDFYQSNKVGTANNLRLVPAEKIYP